MEKIAVVPNAADPAFAAPGPAADGDYVLAVGTLEPRKNLPRIAEAARIAGVKLRIVGGAGWGGVTVPAGAELIHAWTPQELAPLYRGARCLVYASLYEGFGIPILEALAAGTPVVTSRGGATEETAGGAAVLVDPLDPQAIAEGIAEAERRRDELTPLGRARAAEFSWERSAQALAAVYRDAA
jgi:glycosyltransferase involved in cell wall biosynthesis